VTRANVLGSLPTFKGMAARRASVNSLSLYIAPPWLLHSTTATSNGERKSKSDGTAASRHEVNQFVKAEASRAGESWQSQHC